ncbi:hypothetical protein F4553_001457 [Allocatelliglobosispora scoriae]|uniref:Uncharacterized protein n=1 Tax=Allocatelliglobosispora scoriae TaxID=643052 RepID=A0A841BL33_9ACTN|nr:hypothetical protein [Allocatelliglobosispora scoriae]
MTNAVLDGLRSQMPDGWPSMDERHQVGEAT